MKRIINFPCLCCLMLSLLTSCGNSDNGEKDLTNTDTLKIPIVPSKPQSMVKDTITHERLWQEISLYSDSKAYGEGYDAGYEAGSEDAENLDGYEYSYDDACKYKGEKRDDYQLGYSIGYEDGYVDMKADDLDNELEDDF